MITIFTDGSSRGNPGPGGWAVVMINDGEVKELGGRENRTTNNRMELRGAIQGALQVPKNTSAKIIVDSSYVVHGITKWVFGWLKNNWKNSEKENVLNRDLWQELIAATADKKIQWEVIAGHSGTTGNERCDAIATAFGDNAPPKLFSGKFADYPIKNILNRAPTPGTRSEKGKKAYSYVSKVDGIIQKHQTWAECEARVKGKPHVLFRKTLDHNDESAIIASWSK